ncbi:hypothetical protein NDU88_004292 [Pleurodeles waltl]|uniref:Uncharacterized protein n=1 Tax=Pleurodeles waltl TaxID=8319 RepID=A0AAV7RFR1_PLEWA|nr:hypothetical protein NDU88_004292 [Pleurodeles waltl]
MTVSCRILCPVGVPGLALPGGTARNAIGAPLASRHVCVCSSPGGAELWTGGQGAERSGGKDSLETTTIGLGSKSDDRAKGPFQETPAIANSCNPTPTATAPSPSRDILLSGSPGDGNATVKLNA